MSGSRCRCQHAPRVWPGQGAKRLTAAGQPDLLRLARRVPTRRKHEGCGGYYACTPRNLQCEATFSCDLRTNMNLKCCADVATQIPLDCNPSPERPLRRRLPSVVPHRRALAVCDPSMRALLACWGGRPLLGPSSSRIPVVASLARPRCGRSSRRWAASSI